MKEVSRIVNGNMSPVDNGNFSDDSKSKKSCPTHFSLRGRIGQKEFFKGVLVSDFVIFLLVGIIHDSPFLACLLTALLYGCTVPLRVRRLHDRDMSGRWLLAFLAPLAFGLLTSLLWSTNGLNVLLRTFLFTEVLQFVTYGCFKGTWETNQFGPDPLWVEACGMLNVPLDQSEALFNAVMATFLYFKKRHKSKVIVLPGQLEFEKKWTALAQNVFKVTGERPVQGHAMALIDCTSSGDCKKGALIDESGIYMVSGDKELDGWLDWQSFVEKADISRAGFGKIRICSSPSVGLHVLGNLSVVKAIKLFGSILDKVSGGKAKASQVQVVSMRERVKDFATYSVLTIVCLTLLGLGYWGVQCYAHVQNVEKAFTMWCERSPYFEMILGYKGVVSVEVPRWLTGGGNYPCSAKVKCVRDGGPEETIDVTFTARRVSRAERLLLTAGKTVDKVGIRVTQGKIKTASEKLDDINAELNNDWVENLGFWGWIGDDYHIRDVEVK